MPSFTVGSVLVQARVEVPDPPTPLAKPTSVTAVAVASVNPLTAGTYSVQVTALNAFGETDANAAVSVVVGAGQGIQANAVSPAGATKFRIYFAIGTPDKYVEVTALPATIDAASTSVAASVPTTNRAANPDADGGLADAVTIYSWLNKALEQASLLVKGIYDIGGFRTVSAQGLYALPGQWERITFAWFDGIPVAIPSHSEAFYRNRVSGISGRMFITQAADRQLVELYPQPNRSGLSTTLSASMTAADTVASLPTLGGTRAFGLAKIGSEIVAYARLDTITNQLLDLVRGLSGTSAVAHSSGEAVEELNLRFTGFRRYYGDEFKVGDGNKILPLPPGWRDPLTSFIVAKFREVEQDGGEAQRLKQEFISFLQNTARANRQIVGPQQVPDYWGRHDTVFNHLGGGVIIS